MCAGLQSALDDEIAKRKTAESKRAEAERELTVLMDDLKDAQHNLQRMEQSSSRTIGKVNKLSPNGMLAFFIVSALVCCNQILFSTLSLPHGTYFPFLLFFLFFFCVLLKALVS